MCITLNLKIVYFYLYVCVFGIEEEKEVEIFFFRHIASIGLKCLNFLHELCVTGAAAERVGREAKLR